MLLLNTVCLTSHWNEFNLGRRPGPRNKDRNKQDPHSPIIPENILILQDFLNSIHPIRSFATFKFRKALKIGLRTFTRNGC